MKTLNDITIRTVLHPGDLGTVVQLHGSMYNTEYGYGIEFESYVAAGLSEFYKNYNPAKDRVWICEDRNAIIGFLLLMHRENDAAQLRYFFLLPEYRGMGLGRKLMDLFMEFLHSCRYRSAYLWTTDEQTAAAVLYRQYGFTVTEEKPSSSFGKSLIEQRYDLIIPE